MLLAHRLLPDAGNPNLAVLDAGLPLAHLQSTKFMGTIESKTYVLFNAVACVHWVSSYCRRVVEMQPVDIGLVLRRFETPLDWLDMRTAQQLQQQGLGSCILTCKSYPNLFVAGIIGARGARPTLYVRTPSKCKRDLENLLHEPLDAAEFVDRMLEQDPDALENKPEEMDLSLDARTEEVCQKEPRNIRRTLHEIATALALSHAEPDCSTVSLRVDCDDILQAMQSVNLPRNRRQAVFGSHRGQGSKGCVLGLTTDRSNGAAVLSADTSSLSSLTKVLCGSCSRADPHFRFTSIQVNLNSKYGLHTDGHDAGPSRMICCGEFSLGRLWLHDAAAQEWRLLDANCQWIPFDGRELHLTEQWEGPERYSLIFYTHPGWASFGSQEVRQAEELGFAWPSEHDTFSDASLPAFEERVEASRTAKPLDLRSLRNGK